MKHESLWLNVSSEGREASPEREALERKWKDHYGLDGTIHPTITRDCMFGSALRDDVCHPRAQEGGMDADSQGDDADLRALAMAIPGTEWFTATPPIHTTVPENAAFIAAVNPARILRLLDRLAEAKVLAQEGDGDA